MGQRRGHDVLHSVIAYLNWRITSARVPFVSWRNQPAEVGCLSHAINLCNQALHSPQPAFTDAEAAEREKLFADLGAVLDAAKTKSINVTMLAAECPNGTVRTNGDARHKAAAAECPSGRLPVSQSKTRKAAA